MMVSEGRRTAALRLRSVRIGTMMVALAIHSVIAQPGHGSPRQSPAAFNAVVLSFLHTQHDGHFLSPSHTP